MASESLPWSRNSTPSVERVSREQVSWQPSRARRFLTKFVFFLVFSAVLLLAAQEISIAFGVPWLDVRAHFTRWLEAVSRWRTG